MDGPTTSQRQPLLPSSRWAGAPPKRRRMTDRDGDAALPSSPTTVVVTPRAAGDGGGGGMSDGDRRLGDDGDSGGSVDSLISVDSLGGVNSLRSVDSLGSNDSLGSTDSLGSSDSLGSIDGINGGRWPSSSPTVSRRRPPLPRPVERIARRGGGGCAGLRAPPRGGMPLFSLSAALRLAQQSRDRWMERPVVCDGSLPPPPARRSRPALMLPLGGGSDGALGRARQALLAGRFSKERTAAAASPSAPRATGVEGSLFGILPPPVLTKIMQHLLRSLIPDDAPPELLRGCLPTTGGAASAATVPVACVVPPVIVDGGWARPAAPKRPRTSLAGAFVPRAAPAAPMAAAATTTAAAVASRPNPATAELDLSLAVTVDASLWAAASPVFSTCRLLRAALLRAVAVVDVDVPGLGGLPPDDCGSEPAAIAAALTKLRRSLVPALGRCPNLTAVRLALPYGWAGLPAAAEAAADGAAAILRSARSSLRSVALEAHVLPPSIVRALRHIVALAHLDVTEVDVADNACALAELCFRHGRSLRHLGVMRHDGRCAREVATITAALGRCEALTSVRFGCGVSAAVLRGLSPKAAVSLGRVEFGAAVVEPDDLLAGLPAAARAVRHLSVVGASGATVDCLATAIGRLPQLETLETPLVLAQGEDAADLGTALAAAAPATTLSELVVCSAVDDAGLVALAAIPGLTSLTLDDASALSRGGVGALAAAPALRRLVIKEMGADAAAFPAAAVAAVVEAPAPPSLSQVTHLEVEDVALPVLLPSLLRGMDNLRHVRLCRCAVDADDDMAAAGADAAAAAIAVPGPPACSTIGILAALPALVSACVEFCPPLSETSLDVLAWQRSRQDVHITVVGEV